ncbi:DUF4333 domain-containing protein [Mycobacterium hubeiense]|uniref:DUF4333 domain-containing protein n=1 Tax=Mycobacterium hubeiense TaxID=1867256 RepID=UPI001E624D5F|nr:DUF4333 domain-containing protein [Mycobacterium sp. QGD 101]
MRTLVPLFGSIAIGCFALSGCSVSAEVNSTPRVSKEALQKDISDRLTKAGQAPESVTCGDDLVGEVGKTARCEIVMSAMNKTEPVVTVTGVEGSDVKYEMTPATSKEQLETTVSGLLEQASGAPVESVACESGLEGKAGNVAYCNVAAGGLTLRRTVEVTGVNGLMMDIEVVPVLTKDELATSLVDGLAQQLGQRPDSADCSDHLEGKTGTTVDCTVKAGPNTETFAVTVTTVEDGVINYHYEPKA